MEPAGRVDQRRDRGRRSARCGRRARCSARPTVSPRQRLADEDELAAPLDRAVVAHAAHLVVGDRTRARRVVRGQRAPRRLPVARRRRLAERLVRALLVVVPAEAGRSAPAAACRDAAGGFAVSAFNVRCMRSWRPLSCGDSTAGCSAARCRASAATPTACESPPAPVDPNGEPLSERIASGSPISLENPLHERFTPARVGSVIRTSIR